MTYEEFRLELEYQFDRTDFPFFVHDEAHFPPYSYTVGNQDVHGCEFIVFSLSAPFANQILVDIRVDLDFGGKIAVGELNDKWTSLPIKFMKCDPKKVALYAGQAMAMNGHTDNFYQIVFPDSHGYFPDQPEYDCESFSAFQPMLYP